MNKINREAINRCHSCDHNGMVEILPDDQHNHATLARCPHSGMQIIEIKRGAEAHRAAHNPRPRQSPHLTREKPPTEQPEAQTTLL